MSTPSSPGWYPAPDGNGTQWWTGASWSDARQSADGTVLGLPGYQAAPPPGGATDVPAPVPVPNHPTADSVIGSIGNPSAWIIPIVFGIVGFTVFKLFAIFGLLVGLLSIRTTSGIGRVLTVVGIVVSAAAIVWGVIRIVTTGDYSIDNLIF